MEKYYKVSEVMEMLSICKRTFYRWVEQGKIKVAKINGTNRVAESEIERIIKGE